MSSPDIILVEVSDDNSGCSGVHLSLVQETQAEVNLWWREDQLGLHSTALQGYGDGWAIQDLPIECK